MKKIAVYYPIPEDGTSFYRGAGVLSYLKDVQLIPVTHNLSWVDLAGVDMLFIQRPHTELALQMIDVAKRMKVPVWVDMDDMTWEVPTSSDRYRSFAQCSAELMATIVKNATVTTVATRYLKDSLDIYGNVVVVPNAFNDYIFDFSPSIKREPSISWRGSGTHAHDIAWFSKEIEQIDKIYNKDWTFIGMNPELYVDINIALVNAMHLTDYFNYIQFGDKNNICIVPLKPIKFNYAKSNIGWIEATLSNKVTLGPVWKEWLKPGVINYKDNEDFKNKLEALINGDYDIESHINDSKEYIKENLYLSKVNQLRQKIVDELC